MLRSLGHLCLAVLVSVLLGAAIATPVDAAFVYDVAVVGGVDGHGSISLPTDTGTIVALPTDVSASGLTLDLNVMMFGNHVIFTEDDLVGGPLTWTGADPSTPPPLSFVGLTLTTMLNNDEITLVLSDDAGGSGSGICTHLAGDMNACSGDSIDLADVRWTYSNGRTAVVPEPATALLLLSGLTVAVGRCVIRRARGRVI